MAAAYSTTLWSIRGDRVYALEGGPQPGLAYSPALEYLDLP